RAAIRSRTILRWCAVDYFGTLPQMHYRRQLRFNRQCSLRRQAWSTELFHCSPGNLCLRMANLWRFQRLQRHCTRGSTTAWLPLSSQFSTAILGYEPARVLAALAHQSQQLDSRLRLSESSIHLSQPRADHAAVRSLAWCELDLCILGWPAR